MVEDTIVAEIHETRRKMWKEYGEDIEKFLDMLKRWESKETVRISSAEELKRFMKSREVTTQEKE